MTTGLSDLGHWNDTEKLDLTFCVGKSFGEYYPLVVAATTQAAAEWNAVANIQITYLAQEDDACLATVQNPQNPNVRFDVQPLPSGPAGSAFVPGGSRRSRITLGTHVLAEGRPQGYWIAVLLHELGHVLGFPHEHSRLGTVATPCAEAYRYRPLTEQDPYSIMSYTGACSGLWNGDELTVADARGAACLYGPKPGHPAPSCEHRGGVEYQSSVHDVGWGAWVWDRDIAGTVGQSDRYLDALRLKLGQMSSPSGLSICYRAYSPNVGWGLERCDGDTVGGSGGPRFEALQIRLVGGSPGCSVNYRPSVAGLGWQLPVMDGATAGTIGQPLEAIAIWLSGANCPLLPATPTGLVCTPADQKVICTWTPVINATYYTIRRSTSPAGPFAMVSSVTDTDYIDDGLSNGTTYYYVVVAGNAVGESDRSELRSATPLWLPAPQTPSGFACSGSDSSVVCIWNTVSGATSFNLKRSTSIGGVFQTVRQVNIPPLLPSNAIISATPRAFSTGMTRAP